MSIYDDAGCNYYNGVCHRAAKKYIVETADGEVRNVNYRPTTTVVKTGEYKHCSDTIFGDPVPAPKYVASGPKVVAEQPQPVQVRRIQYVRQIPSNTFSLLPRSLPSFSSPATVASRPLRRRANR